MTDAITFDEILGLSDGLSNLPGIDYHIGGAGDDPLTGSGTVANYLWGMLVMTRS